MAGQTFVVGINGGATHTEFALISERLDLLAQVRLGSSNFRNVGFESARDSLIQGVIDVIRQAGVESVQVAGIGVGLAGVDHPSERAMFHDALEAAFPGKQVIVENDAVVALVRGSGRRYGIIVISGTGSIALGINARGARARAGGWGYHLDQGSGYAIARETLSAVVRAWDGTGPATRLTERITARLNLTEPRQLVNWLYAPERRVDEIAALAAETIALAETDLVATGIILQAADALAANVIALGRQLDLAVVPFPLVLSGSILERCVLLRDLFTASVQPMLPGAVITAAHHEAAVGAAMMVLESLGIAVPAVELPATIMPVRRPSEQRNRLTMDISRRLTFDLVTLMNFEDRRVPQAIAPELPRIAALIDAIAERFAKGGRLIMAGAGTSGRLAVLDAAECGPTFSAMPDEVIGILAGGPAAMTNSIEGAEDSEQGGRESIAALGVGPLDSVIGVAASGSTPFVRGVLREAAERGALTGSLACAPRAPISDLAQHPIEIVTGPEVITGSTRLKAGTAQKMVLNMISTGVMVRVGRTLNNLMTDMRISNAKLQERAGVIVAEATGLPLADARATLERCNGEMKTAITSAWLGIAPEEARQRLAAVNGNLNRIRLEDRSKSS